jgi:primase-polymerase (primpol)-like protein
MRADPEGGIVTRPVPLAVNVAGIPEVLRAVGRWVLWLYLLRDGRWTKVPHRPSGAFAKSNDPSTWCSFDEALAASRRFDGIGFMLGDGWSGIDFDDVTDAAQLYLRRIASYLERSPGGDGYKAIGRSVRIGGEIKFSTDPLTVTTWQRPRFFAITGHGSGDPTVDLTVVLDEWFPPPTPLTLSSTREGYALAAECTDDDLLIAAFANDQNGHEILALYRGETSAYGHDHSRADLALCCHLAFWTNYDVERIDRMFRLSGLYRKKWDRISYRRATIGKAIAQGPVAATLSGLVDIRGV